MDERKPPVNWRKWGGIAAAVGGVAIAGAGLFWARERSAETPDHDVLATDGAFQLRRYKPFLVAETVQQGTRDRALGNGFKVLADYIFAQSRGGEEIEMTAPVLATKARPEKIAMTAPVLANEDVDGGWRVRFVMPRKFTRATLPKPGPGVSIAEVPGRKVAVVRFAGNGDDARLAVEEAALLEWIATRGLIPAGDIEHGFYNSPIVPGPVRRNEVMIAVE